jgi:Outer membrane protein beta-barrel domain
VVRLVLTLLVVLFAASARAQSAYVAGTIGADVSRVTHTDANFYSSSPDGSETLSGSVRVGTAIGPSWGVELEFVHSGRSHDQVTPVVSPLATNTSTTPAPVITLPGFAFTSASSNVIPIRFVQSDIRQSHSDLDALIWVRQGVGGSVDLVYLGGVAFSRQRTEISQNFPTILGLIAPLPPNSAFRSTTISYGTRPLAGVEARIGFTSHVRLIPGVRLQGIADGWLLRPYVGLGWFF